MESNAIVVAILALIAIPAVASGVTGLLGKLIGYGLHPKAILYLVSLLITGVVMWTAGSTVFPQWAGDPVAYITAWQLWTAGVVASAQTIYRLLQPKLWPDTPAITANK